MTCFNFKLGFFVFIFVFVSVMYHENIVYEPTHKELKGTHPAWKYQRGKNAWCG